MWRGGPFAHLEVQFSFRGCVSACFTFVLYKHLFNRIFLYLAPTPDSPRITTHTYIQLSSFRTSSWEGPPGMWLVIHIAVTAHIHCLAYASVDIQQSVQFSSAWKNSVTHLCFLHTFMSDATLPVCRSVAICNKEKHSYC